MGMAIEAQGRPAPSRRLYIIGTGAIASTHVDAADKLTQPLEWRGADVNPDQLARFVKKHPHVTPCDSTAGMLAEAPREDDVVLVAAWPSEHCALTCQALESGRHVLCEKPLGTSVEEARRMLDAARRANRRLGCCSTRFLGQAVVDALADRLRAQALGPLYHVRWCCRTQRTRPGIEYQPETPWFLERRFAGGGIILDWAPYDFTVLNFLLDPDAVEVHRAWLAAPETGAETPVDVTPDVEYHGAAWLVYALPGGGRVPVTYERASCTHGKARRVFEFEGLRGAARLDWLEQDGLWLTHDAKGWPVSEHVAAAPDDLGPLDRPLHFFLETLRAGTGPAVLDGRAAFNFACCRAIYDCAASGEVQTVRKEDWL